MFQFYLVKDFSLNKTGAETSRVQMQKGAFELNIAFPFKAVIWKMFMYQVD